MHKDVRDAVDKAQRAGFHIRELRGHAWGRVECSCGESIPIYSSGRNPTNGAKKIKWFTNKHRKH
jgi:hypothetical protein